MIRNLTFFSFSLFLFFCLGRFLPFWNLAEIKIGSVGTLGHCTGLHVNETTLLLVIAFGLFVSALALSDQLEREMPYGAFPRRFSRALSAPLCGSTGKYSSEGAAREWSTVVIVIGIFISRLLF